MTKIATDFASKFAVAFVAVAMVFMSFASAAQAQTTEDLQQMINDLLAQVAQLQGEVTGSSATADVCPYTWTRSLSQGTEGADVMKLQQFLNADADTRVAAEGAGSIGAETMYYGPATAAAVSKFQVKYRADILSPVSLVNPTGFFGPSSISKANMLCVAAPVVEEGEEEEGEEEGEEEEEEDFVLRGEASLDNMEIDSASDDEIEEGAEDAEIAEVTLEFTNGDAEISRMDITLNGVADVWDIFDSISLWVDGDKIAEEDASDEDDYLDTTGSAGELRFSNLDLIAEEDEEVVITIAATVRNIDNDELGAYTVSVDSLRFFDADGVATTESTGFDFGSTESFTIEEEGYEDEVLVKTNSNDPDAATLQVEDDKKSDWYNVFTFDLDTDDSINDIEFNEIQVTVNLSSSTYNTIVDDAEIVIDGVTIDDVTVTGGATATAVLTFDVDGDVVVDAGDRVAAELMLRFKSLAAGNEGITVQAEITSAQADLIDAEGADDLDTDQLSGSATGDAHTLRTTGIDVTVEDASAAVTVQDGNLNDYATFEIEVEVTAFEQDVFIDVDGNTSMAYSLRDGAGNVVSAGTSTVVLTSSADENSGYFEINEGESETLTLTVTYVPGAANTQARLRMDSISFAPTAVAATQVQTTLPITDYRTNVVTIVN